MPRYGVYLALGDKRAVSSFLWSKAVFVLRVAANFSRWCMCSNIAPGVSSTAARGLWLQEGFARQVGLSVPRAQQQVRRGRIHGFAWVQAWRLVYLLCGSRRGSV